MSRSHAAMINVQIFNYDIYDHVTAFSIALRSWPHKRLFITAVSLFESAPASDQSYCTLAQKRSYMRYTSSDIHLQYDTAAYNSVYGHRLRLKVWYVMLHACNHVAFVDFIYLLYLIVYLFYGVNNKVHKCMCEGEILQPAGDRLSAGVHPFVLLRPQ